MKQKNFKRLELLFGLGVMLLSSIVYLITMGKSASLWDCPEFITTFTKLEVGHPPGAPFYMLVYNFFETLIGFSSASAALAANALSGIMSGCTVMLLFLSISHLFCRASSNLSEIRNQDTTLPKYTAYLALGTALVGSLMYAFSDTFWFSAVEAEVYSFSSLFTALVFYLMLKWESVAHTETADRWIVGIVYLMGLSVGVHLLNLLCIPAMSLIYYYKKVENPNWKGAFLALLLSFGFIAIIMFGIVQGVPEVAGWFDLFAVNVLGLPFNTGLVVYLLLLVAVLVWSYVESIRIKPRQRLLQSLFFLSILLMGIPFMGDGWFLPILIIVLAAWWIFRSSSFSSKLANLVTLCLAVFFLGISTYGVILIRANSDIPMNQNTPSDVFALRKYLSREQYGSTPLFYGKTYASVPERNSDGSAKRIEKHGWKKKNKTKDTDKDQYIKEPSIDIVYRSDMNMFFPRMYNATQAHFKPGYEIWGDVTGRQMDIEQMGQHQTVTVPTFAENLRYFFNYQVNYMYWRYFMWNFSGRQNDMLGQGELTRGNWCTGIPFVDRFIIGPQNEDMPALLKDNKAHNTYFMLPFILGLLGIAFQLGRSKKGNETFFITFMLFFMTGLAIVLYINQTPYQVRERDYAYAGSFYAFAIWVGFGVAFLAELLDKFMGSKRNPKAPLLATLVSLSVPALVFAQNYDDHNRNGRTLVADFGRNYLESCEENAILFCNGDNDTFPLWYAQEVEGVRRDLRVCNTSYLQADWYIDQMKKDAYESKALPISWNSEQYSGEKLGIVQIVPIIKDTLQLGQALSFATSEDPALKRALDPNMDITYIPADVFELRFNRDSLLLHDAISPEDTVYMNAANSMIFDFKNKRYLGKQESTILNLMLNNKLKRPVYYCYTVSDSEYVGMRDYFRQTGAAYRVMPFRTDTDQSKIDLDRMYNNVMTKFRFGGANIPGLYMDENARRLCEGYRSEIFARLAEALLQNGEKEKAQAVLKKGLTNILPEVVPHSRTSLPLILSLYHAGMHKEANEIAEGMCAEALKMLDWVTQLPYQQINGCWRDIEESLLVCTQVARITKEYEPEYYKTIEAPVYKYVKMFSDKRAE